MNAYIYQDDLHCEDCAEKIKEKLTFNPYVSGYSFDSKDYPAGPFPDGGGEADSPQHCGSCGLFLENPLTSDGEEYVRQAVEEDQENNDHESVALQYWLPFYKPQIFI